MSNEYLTPPQPTPAPHGEGFLTALGRSAKRLSVVFIALGLLAIALGYNGAAGYASVPAQFPYLISGGVLGICLIIIGVGLMIVQSGREDQARTEALLTQLVELTRASSATVSPDIPDDATGLVVAGTASYHRPSCRLVSGRAGADYLTATEARDRDLAACRVCTPDLVTAR